MSKTKILLVQIAGCLTLGAVLGVAFWLFDGGRACKKANAQKMALENKIVKVYQGKWHKDYLEVIK